MSSNQIPVNMRAILMEQFGGPEVLQIKEVPTPVPSQGTALIKIKAFGINHAEMHMRRGEWAESMPIIGIECVGVIAACPGGEFKIGTPIATLMGGLGRTINGSYAEYTVAPVSNIVPLAHDEEGLQKLGLAWEDLAAIPETYATAWTTVFRNLNLQAGQKLLIRGGTSNLGQAAINLAVQAGAEVTATSRNAARFEELKKLGAKDVLLEVPDLSARVAETGHGKFDVLLNLVGNTVVLDSLKMVRRGGKMCLAGWLGGLAPIADFNPLLQMASGIDFNFFGSFVFGTGEFPLSDVPLGDIVQTVADKKFTAKPARVFRFEEIQEVHRVMESGGASGKMVVRVE
jgi:NADPH:quinone reductase